MEISKFTVVLGLIVIGFMMSWHVLMRTMKAGPNEVLVISGRRRWIRRADGTAFLVGFRMMKGGRTFVWPFIERVDRLSLEPMNIGFSAQNVQTKDNKRIDLNGLVTVKIEATEMGIAMASQHFLSMTPEQVSVFIKQYMEAKLCNIAGMMASEDMFADRDKFINKLRDSYSKEIGEMGMKLVSISIAELVESAVKPAPSLISV